MVVMAAALLGGCQPTSGDLLSSGQDMAVAMPAKAANASASVGGVTVNFTGLPAGAGGSVTVTSLSGYFLWFSNAQTVGALVPGLYTLAAGNVVRNGVTYVPAFYSQPLAVVGGITLAVTVPYAPLGSAPPAATGDLAVTIGGLTAGAGGSVSVTGPNGYVQWFTTSQTLAKLVPGTYHVAAGNITSGGVTYVAAPASQSVTVTGGVTAAAIVTYSGPATPPPPAAGSLVLTVSGLPAGTNGAITVTGPSAFSRTVTASQTLTGLLAAHTRSPPLASPAGRQPIRRRPLRRCAPLLPA